MQIRGELFADFVRKRPARITVRGHDQYRGSGFRRGLRNLCNDVIARCHGDLRAEVTKAHFGLRRAGEFTAGILDNYFASGQGGFRHDILNCDIGHLPIAPRIEAKSTLQEHTVPRLHRQQLRLARL